MALRRNIRRYKPTIVAKILKFILLLLTLVALAIGGFIFYFNGQHVKDPLLSLLNERSGASFSAEKVEFSPIYPDVLKLENIGINKGHIDSLYIEYDLKSLLSGKQLVIRELYARGIQVYPQDFETLLKKKLGFESVNFKTIRLEDLNIHSLRLTAKHVSLKLNNTDITSGHKILPQDGSISFSEGSLDGHFVKDLKAELYFPSPENIHLKNLEASLLGGRISGEVLVNPSQKELDFSNLTASNLVLKEPQKIMQHYSIKAKEADLRKVVVVYNQEDLLLSGISGRMEDLVIGKEPLSGNFQGSIDELSLPQRQLTLENNRLMADIKESSVKFSMDGDYLEGHYSISGEHLKNEHLLNISSLMLSNQKIELDDTLYSLIKDTLSRNSITLHNTTFSHLSFLSKRSGLPLSIKDISGALDGFTLSLDGTVKSSPAGVLELKLGGLLYSDLGFSQIDILSSFTDNLINISVPELRLHDTKLNIAASYNLLTSQGYLLASGKNLELAEFNSNLIPHLFGGRVNLDVDLRTTQPFEKLPQSLQGHVSLQGKNIIISSLGFDLINGGPKENYHLSGEDFLDALKQGDSGISELNLNLNCTGKEAKLSGSLDLATSLATISARVNLETLQLFGKSFFISFPKDSVTTVETAGTLNSPEFTIEALSRGEPRPGLFVTGEQTQALFLQQQEEKRKKETLLMMHEKISDAVKGLLERQKEEAEAEEERNKAQAALSVQTGQYSADTPASPQLERTKKEEATGNQENKTKDTVKTASADPDSPPKEMKTDPVDALETEILNNL